MSDLNLTARTQDPDDRFCVLAARYLADDLDSAESEEFRVLLAADPTRCGQLSTMALYSHWISAQVALELHEQFVSSLSHPPTRTARQYFSFHRGVQRGADRRYYRGSLVVGTLIIFVVAAAFAGLYLKIVRSWQDDDRLAQPAQADGVESSSTQVAIVRKADATDWSANTKPKNLDATISQGEKIAIKAGRVELQLKQGTTLLVEGPAEWTVDGDNSATVKRGKLVATVPQRAVGFTLKTPAARIVDLGTEFGVEVSESGYADVIVSRGRVSVNATRGTASPHLASFILNAGEAKRVQADGTIDVTNVAKSGLANLLASGSSAKQIEHKVFPTGLVAYWALDEDGESIRDGFGVNHGQTSLQNRTNGLIGRAALQSTGRPGKLAEIYSCEPAGTFSEAISVEALLVTSWSGKPGDTDFICRQVQGSTVLASLAFQNDDRGSVKGPSLAWNIATERGLQSLHLPLVGRAGGNTLASLKDGKPHHVVATFDGVSGEMALYIDGTERMRQSGVPAPLLGTNELEQSSVENSTELSEDPFTGVLDEIAVYCISLSPAIVAAHWRNVLRGQGYFNRTRF